MNLTTEDLEEEGIDEHEATRMVTRDKVLKKAGMSEAERQKLLINAQLDQGDEDDVGFEASVMVFCTSCKTSVDVEAGAPNCPDCGAHLEMD